MFLSLCVGMYTPGMMTDVVREVKEAARIREDALLSRVRAMVEERSWTMNETQMKLVRNVEEMKVCSKCSKPAMPRHSTFRNSISTCFQIQINQLKAEKYETKGQITRLEDEVKSLRALLMHALNYDRSPVLNKSATSDRHLFMRQNSGASVRSTPQDRSKRHSLSLNYGTMHQDDAIVLNGITESMLSGDSVIDQDQFNELLKAEQMKYVNGDGVNVNGIGDARQNTNEIYVNGADDDVGNGTLVQMEKDNLDLRRELQDALANKKNADKKIQT